MEIITKDRSLESDWKLPIFITETYATQFASWTIQLSVSFEFEWNLLPEWVDEYPAAEDSLPSKRSVSKPAFQDSVSVCNANLPCSSLLALRTRLRASPL